MRMTNWKMNSTVVVGVLIVALVEVQDPCRRPQFLLGSVVRLCGVIFFCLNYGPNLKKNQLMSLSDSIYFTIFFTVPVRDRNLVKGGP